MGRNVVLMPHMTRTASETEKTMDVSDLSEIKFFVLYIESIGGTAPTLDVVVENVVEVQSTEDTVYPMKEITDTLATFPQQTATGTTIKVGYDTGKALGNLIRARATLGGTSPSFKFSVIAVGK